MKGDVMKLCTFCQVEKTLDCFTKNKNMKDGLDRNCRECRAVAKKASYERNREKNLVKMKAYREANKEKIAETKKRSRLKKIDEYKQKQRERYYANREQILADTKKKRLENLDHHLKKEAEVRARHREKRNEWQKQYYQDTKPERLKYHAKYMRDRIKRDPVYALSRLVRRRITIALSKGGYLKTSPTREMLGCDYDELKAHLERQFLKGMSWENRGDWHIDHIVPLSSAGSEEELLALCHFTNLRPLWASDNISKGAKMVSLI